MLNAQVGRDPLLLVVTQRLTLLQCAAIFLQECNSKVLDPELLAHLLGRLVPTRIERSLRTGLI